MIVSKRVLGRYAAGTILAGLTTGTALSAELQVPLGKPILTISGKITLRNKGEAAQFDRDMLEALGMTGFETSTPWYPEPVRFEGIRMDHLMETVGASGDRVLAYALNDYSTELPLSDFKKYSVLLALKRNGEYMPVRDKGPLFIIYPFDSDPELRHQRFYSRSAWQLARLVVS
jgi:hypothetical protein